MPLPGVPRRMKSWSGKGVSLCSSSVNLPNHKTKDLLNNTTLEWCLPEDPLKKIGQMKNEGGREREYQYKLVNKKKKQRKRNVSTQREVEVEVEKEGMDGESIENSDKRIHIEKP